jgi:sodium transport system permease protein
VNPGNVRLVYAKEIRDTIRDRRTLFISLVLPILLYPLLMIGFTQVSLAAHRRFTEQVQKVTVTGGALAADMAKRVSESEGGLEVVESVDPEAGIRSGGLDAWIELAEGFEEQIPAGGQGTVRVHFDSTKESSQAARRKVTRIVRDYGQQVLRDRGLSEADIEPVRVAEEDAASGRQRGAKRFGPLLALILVIMALSGAFYPAVDIMAGEKERGTMETLLVCPATRTEIVVGKYLTVLTMTLVTALLNFLSMGLTFSHFAKLIPKGAGEMALEISPGVAGIIVLALLPLAGLFSAIALALSTFARTYKEGQYYLTPLFIAVMPLAMVALIPGTELATFAVVPVAGVVTLVRELLLESAGAGTVLLVLVTSAAYAVLAIWWTVSMFNKEDILFRDPGGAEFTLLQKARGKGEVPGPAQALALPAVALALIYFASPWFAKLENGVAVGFLFLQVGLILLLPILAVGWYRFDIKKTLSLRMPRPLAWPAALIGAPAVLAVVMCVTQLIGFDEKSVEPLAKEFEKLLETIGLPALLLLPPIAEEVFFRGFLLSGFRRGGKAVRAVILVAVIFAVFHMTPSKYLPTGLIGIWLGYLVVATGSLYPAILAHLVNNGIGFAVAILAPTMEAPDWVALPALALVVAAVWMLERVRRAGRPAGGG